MVTDMFRNSYVIIYCRFKIRSSLNVKSPVNFRTIKGPEEKNQ